MSFNEIISYPFGLVLGFLYQIFNSNYALALLVFTILSKLILLPGSIKQQKSQAISTRTKAKVDRIKKKYEGDKEKINQELSAFYQQEGYGSVFGGCGSMLLQFPIIIGLYGSIYKPLSYILRIPKDIVNQLINTAKDSGFLEGITNSRLYEISLLSKVDQLQAKLPEISASIFDEMRNFDFTIFGLPLGAYPHDQTSYMAVPIAAFLSAMTLSIYGFMRQRKLNPEAAKNPANGCMMFFSPFLSLWLSYTFPLGIGIYWTLNSILSLIQMIVLNYIYHPDKVVAKLLVEETQTRRSKELTVKNNTRLLKNM